MSVNVRVGMQCKITETLSDPSLSDADVVHSNYDYSAVLKSDSSVPATKAVSKVIALSAGAKTLDLTALTGANGATVDMTGLKLQVWRLKNLGTNDMTFTFGASNPYEAFGADFKFTLKAGQRAMFFGNDSTPDVASGAKNIDVAGTGTQTFENTMVFG